MISIPYLEIAFALFLMNLPEGTTEFTIYYPEKPIPNYTWTYQEDGTWEGKISNKPIKELRQLGLKHLKVQMKSPLTSKTKRINLKAQDSDKQISLGKWSLSGLNIRIVKNDSQKEVDLSRWIQKKEEKIYLNGELLTVLTVVSTGEVGFHTNNNFCLKGSPLIKYKKKR